MGKGTPNPVINLSRSRGATEIQVPGITNTVLSFTLSGVADTQALPAAMEPATLVRISNSEDMYIRFDSSATAATATDTLMIRGTEPQRIPEGVTHVSVLQVTTAGVATITLYA